MSAKVDVLAVLDSVIQRSGHIVACDVVQARAAIAELIGSARYAGDLLERHLEERESRGHKTHHSRAMLADLRAALAAVTGEGQG